MLVPVLVPVPVLAPVPVHARHDGGAGDERQQPLLELEKEERGHHGALHQCGDQVPAPRGSKAHATEVTSWHACRGLWLAARRPAPQDSGHRPKRSCYCSASSRWRTAHLRNDGRSHLIMHVSFEALRVVERRSGGGAWQLRGGPSLAGGRPRGLAHRKR